MSSPVVEKEFIWKFVDQITDGVKQARQEMQDAASTARKVSNDVKDTGTDWNKMGSNAEDSARKASQAMDDMKKTILSYQHAWADSSKSIRSQLNLYERQLNGIPREKITNLHVKVDDSALKAHERMIHDVPKNKNVFLNLKDNFTNGFHRFNSEVQESERHVHSFRDILVGTFLGNAILNGIYAIGNGIKGLIATGYQYDKEQQTMIASWRTLTGSAAEGQKMVNMTNQLAISAQNATSMVNDLNQRFYAVTSNADKTRELSKSVLTLQDAFHASDAAIENFSTQWAQMVGNGKASAQDMLSIQNVFPKFRQELLKYEQQIHHSKNMTMADLNAMMSAGKISSNDMNTVLIRMGHEYQNATKNFTTTIDGMTRTIRATVPVLTGALIKPFTKTESPVYAAVSRWVTDTKTRREFNKLGQVASQGMAKVVQAFAGGHVGTSQIERELDGMVIGLGQKIKALTDVIAKNAGNIKATFSIIGSVIKIFAEAAGAAIMDVARVFGIFGSSAKNSASPLQAIANLLKDVANNKAAIQALGVVMLSVFTVNKYVAFIKWVKDLKEAMTFSATIKGLKLLGSAFGTMAGAGIKALGGLISGTKELTVANAALDIALSPITLWVAGIAAIGVAFYEAYKHIKPFREIVNKAGLAIKKFFIGKLGWEKSIASEFSKLGKDFQKFAKKIPQFFKGVGKAIAKVIVIGLALPVGIAVTLMKPLIKPLQNSTKALIRTVQKQWQSFSKWLGKLFNPVAKLWKRVWNGWARIFSTIWKSLRKTASSGMKAIERLISPAVKTIEKVWTTSWNAIVRFFSGIWRTITSLGKSGMQLLQGAISGPLNTISNIWHSAWNSISNFFKGIWDGIKQAAQDGMNGVINVINAGISAINKVWSFFTGHGTGVKELGHVHFAQGGVVRRHLSVINDGDGPDWKELVQTPDGGLYMSQERNWTGFLPEGTRVYSGPETRQIMNAVGVSHYADGGIVGDVEEGIDWAKGSLDNLGSWMGDKIDAIMDFLDDPLKAVKGLLKKATSGMTDRLGHYGELATGALDKLTQPISDWFKKNLEPILDKLEEANPGGAGVARWRPFIKRAAKMEGIALTPTMMQKMLTQINTESGGNPGAIGGTDGLADGHATGLLQFKPGTFRSWIWHGHGNIMNGFDQILAAFNALQHGGEGGWGNFGIPGKGWATGGEITSQQFGWVGDNAQHHEIILNPYATSAEPLLDRAFETTAAAQPASQANSGGSKLDRMISLLEQLVDLLGNSSDPQVVLDVDGLRKVLGRKDSGEFSMKKG